MVLISTNNMNNETMGPFWYEDVLAVEQYNEETSLQISLMGQCKEDVTPVC